MTILGILCAIFLVLWVVTMMIHERLRVRYNEVLRIVNGGHGQVRRMAGILHCGHGSTAKLEHPLGDYGVPYSRTITELDGEHVVIFAPAFTQHKAQSPDPKAKR